MTLETILALLSPILVVINIILMVVRWKEKNRIKAKEEVWQKNMQSIVNTVAKMQERMDKNLIQDAKELRSGIDAIGNFAHGIYDALNKELRIQ